MSEQDAVERIDRQLGRVLKGIRDDNPKDLEFYMRTVAAYRGAYSELLKEAQAQQRNLEASQQENERLREFLNDIGYPDTAINVILDATEVVDVLEEESQDD